MILVGLVGLVEVGPSMFDWARAWAISLGAKAEEMTMFDDAARGNARVDSLGASRVRLDFNPGKDDLVDRIKRKTAELIDLCDTIGGGHQAHGEIARCVSLAMTHYEDAAMWAVKAATAKR